MKLLSRTGTWKDSKAKRLRDKFRRVLSEDRDATQFEKTVLLVEEMILDTSLAMATGSGSGWYNLLNSYDSEKDFFEQDAEFQRDAAVLISSNIGLAMLLHGAGVSQMEFVVGRSVALRPLTKVMFNPLVVLPMAMLETTFTVPEIAGPQYQSAMTGQPNMGSAGHDLIYGNKSWRDYWDAIFR